MIDRRRNRQAALVRRPRNRNAKEQHHSPFYMGIQRVLKEKSKAMDHNVEW